MASSAVSSTLFYSPICPKALSKSNLSPSSAFFGRFHANATAIVHRGRDREGVVKSQTFDFSGSFYGESFDDDDDEYDDDDDMMGGSPMDERESYPCPPGLREYETMSVLRPDMSEDERLALTQKYEELLVAGGGMYIEVFNRGVIPLAYDIKRKNKAGETNTYLDGIYLLFVYFTKPESINALETTLNMDDNVIRHSTFKVKKNKVQEWSSPISES
ncbi:30S ribosomal protein S6 alpha, chloroplastic [Linum perenne]